MDDAPLSSIVYRLSSDPWTSGVGSLYALFALFSRTVIKRIRNRLIQRQRAPLDPGGCERRLVELRARDRQVAVVLGAFNRLQLASGSVEQRFDGAKQPRRASWLPYRAGNPRQSHQAFGDTPRVA